MSQSSNTTPHPAEAGAQDRAAERIGIFGGTFDPPHLGHLFVAEEARLRCDLSRVLWVPNNVPAHREGKMARAEAAARVDLTECAIRDNAAFELSRVEIDRPGPSYLYDTLGALREAYPGAELFFICGADSLRDVLTWYRGADLFTLCTFIAASRPGVDGAAVRDALPEDLRKRMIWLEVPGLYIASRDLRARVARGLPIRYLVPDEVERHIHKHCLYEAE